MLPALALLAALQGVQAVEKKNPSFEEMIRMPVVLTVPGMEAVGVERDVVYKTAEDQPLHLDVYSPPGPEALLRSLPGCRIEPPLAG